MQKVVRTGIALSALLAWSIAVAQQNVPTQVAQAAPAPEAATTATTATEGAAVAEGTTGTVTIPGVGAVGTGTAVAVGAGALVGTALIVDANKDETPGTTGTR